MKATEILLSAFVHLDLSISLFSIIKRRDILDEVWIVCRCNIAFMEDSLHGKRHIEIIVVKVDQFCTAAFVVPCEA